MRMLKGFAVLIALALQVSAQSRPPKILEIYRDFLKPESEAAYAAYSDIERDIARVCIELAFPHAYLAIESLTGPKEVWFLNGWESSAEQGQVADDYAKNAPLAAALEKHAKRKASVVLTPIEVFAKYRQHSGSSEPWGMGMGRFLVITVTRASGRMDGTTFETADGTKFILLPANERAVADAKAAAIGAETRVFAVRPYWSKPAEEWVSADPAFWRLVAVR
jgi:hypothetical protein